MDDGTVGRGFRALRRRNGWTQRTLAQRAGVPQSTVSLVESGRLDQVRLPTLRSVGRALGISVEIRPRWPVADVAKLIDADHASLVERVVRILQRDGWEVLVEYTFNDYGERGSVDLLAWHAGRRALLLVEVKTRVVDIQELHATFDRKARIVLRLVARERGWRPLAVGKVLVVTETHANREQVRRHAATFGATFPARARAVQRWIRQPNSPLVGLWFLSNIGPIDHPNGRGRLPTANRAV